MIRHMLGYQEYQCVAGLSGVRYIVDCGANIGCATYYLLAQYPTARAVVVEPDPDNMRVCRRSLAHFGHRVTYIQAAVWPESTPLHMERWTTGDRNECSFSVRPARDGEQVDCVGLSIGEVLATAGFPQADLLKVDIEGAEVALFTNRCDIWLPVVGVLAIELHGERCAAAVHRALAPANPQVRHQGETTVFDLRPAPTAGAA